MNYSGYLGAVMNYNRKYVFAAACLAMLVFGIVMTILGSVLPSLIVKFGLDKADAGSLFPLMTVGMLIGSLFFGPVVDRYGYKIPFILSCALILAGLEVLAFENQLSIMRLAMFLVGLGGGVVNGGSNALVADIAEEDRGAKLSLLGVFFGIGAFGIPMSLGVLLGYFDYTTLIAVIGWTLLIPILFFLFIRFPAPKQMQGFPLKEGLKLIKEVPLLLFGLILFFESGMEITVGGWTSTFFSEELMIDTSRAVFYLSFYWLALMAARIIIPKLLKTMQADRLLRGFIFLAIAGSLLLIFTRNLGLALAGVMLIGFGFAAVFPVILGLVGDRYPHLSGTAFSVVFVMALTGGSLMPYLSGLVGNSHGLRMAFIIVPVSLVIMLGLLSVVQRRNQAGS